MCYLCHAPAPGPTYKWVVREEVWTDRNGAVSRLPLHKRQSVHYFVIGLNYSHYGAARKGPFTSKDYARSLVRLLNKDLPSCSRTGRLRRKMKKKTTRNSRFTKLVA